MADRPGGATAGDLAALLAGRPGGCSVAAGGVTVRLTGVEAYAGVWQDPASHAHRDNNRRLQELVAELVAELQTLSVQAIETAEG